MKHSVEYWYYSVLYGAVIPCSFILSLYFEWIDYEICCREFVFELLSSQKISTDSAFVKEHYGIESLEIHGRIITNSTVLFAIMFIMFVVGRISQAIMGLEQNPILDNYVLELKGLASLGAVAIVSGLFIFVIPTPYSEAAQLGRRTIRPDASGYFFYWILWTLFFVSASSLLTARKITLKPR